MQGKWKQNNKLEQKYKPTAAEGRGLAIKQNKEREKEVRKEGRKAENIILEGLGLVPYSPGLLLSMDRNTGEVQNSQTFLGLRLTPISETDFPTICATMLRSIK